MVDIASNNPGFSSLVAAVIKADLVPALTNPAAPVTVFAPTDAAFDAALGALGLTLETIDVPTLTAILLHHVVEGKVLSPTVVGLTAAPTLNGNVGVRVENGGVVLTDALGIDANVVTVDLEAQNGVVHVIDKVLLPEDLRPVIFPEPVLPATVVDIAAGNPDFSSLVAAVNKAGLAGALTDPASPVTVFAPTNAAFDAALGALGLTLETIDVPTLTAILAAPRGRR